MSTAARVRACRAISRRTFRIASDRPTRVGIEGPSSAPSSSRCFRIRDAVWPITEARPLSTEQERGESSATESDAVFRPQVRNLDTGLAESHGAVSRAHGGIGQPQVGRRPAAENELLPGVQADDFGRVG